MTQEDALNRLHSGLLSYGGFLRNPVRVPTYSCMACAGPVDPEKKYTFCYRCLMYQGDVRAADAVGFMIYGLNGAQSGQIMRSYKGRPIPSPQHRRTVASIAVLGVRRHKDCASRLVGVPTTMWATVPSLGGRVGVHPLRAILTEEIAAGSEVLIEPSSVIRDARSMRPENYVVRSEIPPGTHVMVIDDTWTTGSHIQSVSGALKAAGATAVSALSLARWMDLSWKPTKPFLEGYVNPQPYDPGRCPWTSGVCP